MRRLFSRGDQNTGGSADPTEVPSGAGRPISLIVGLGNPGAEYAGNRHNLGFWTINRLARQLHIEITKHTKTASLGEGTHAGRPLILAKPRTFVNRSGEAVRVLAQRYKLEPEQILVVHDELDLPIGRVRLRASGSHGGNNGMRSILAVLASREVPRVRIGIGRPVRDGVPSYDPEVIAGWVLANPPPDERTILDAAVERAREAIMMALDEGMEAAMNRFNREE